MLIYNEFKPLSKDTFVFKTLLQTNQKDIFICPQTSKLYLLTTFASQWQYEVLNELISKHVFQTIRGFFKKKHIYYCFSQLQAQQTLSAWLKHNQGSKQSINQHFCSQLLHNTAQILFLLQTVGIYLKILTPTCIIVHENSKNDYKFSLAYPLCYNLFEGLTQSVVRQHIEFCAPQILMQINSQDDLVRKQFPKSALYSLGLLLLFCFGYTIPSQKRFEAFHNPKQLNLFIKTIRKQIKLLHRGKFISKNIKILLERNQLVRDNTQTFLIKFFSPILDSLRRTNGSQQREKTRQRIAPTVFEDTLQAQRIGLRNTIDIEGSAISSTTTQDINMHLTTHKQSNQQLIRSQIGKQFIEMITSPKEKGSEDLQRNVNTIQANGLASPIEIHLNWNQSSERSSNDDSITNNVKQFERVYPKIKDQHLSNTCLCEDKQVKLRYNSRHISKSQNRLQQYTEDNFQIKINQPPNKPHNQNQTPHQPLPQAKPDKTVTHIFSFQQHLQHQQSPRTQLSAQTPQVTHHPSLHDPNDQRLLRKKFTRQSQAIFIILLVIYLIYKIVDDICY